MSTSLPLERLVPIVLLAALGAAFLGILAGSRGGNTTGFAEELVGRAFSSENLKSGRFDAAARVSLDSAPIPQLSSFEISMNGAFDNRAARPKGRVEMSFAGLGRSIEAGFVSTGRAAFVTLGDSAYRVPRRRLERAAAGSPSRPEDLTALSAFGVNPRSWVENATYKGSAKVAGVDTDHVKAELNVGRMLDDVFRLGTASGARISGLSNEQKEQAKGAVDKASLDLYTAKADGSLHRLSARVRVDSPEGGGDARAGGSGRITFDVRFRDVNEPQRITAPQRSRPFNQLQPALNARFLGSVAGGAPTRASAPGSRRARRGAGAPRAAVAPDAAQHYLDCVESARRRADLRKCAPLLP